MILDDVTLGWGPFPSMRTSKRALTVRTCETLLREDHAIAKPINEIVMRIALCSFLLQAARGFVTAPSFSGSQISCSGARNSNTFLRAVDFDGLMDMDVVIYSEKDSDTKYIGAVQEDGTLSPLSAWSSDPAFGDSVELVVDEEDRPGLQGNQIVVHSIIPEESLSYSSRQVGGGMGPANPHGEESELLYYVEQNLLDDIKLKINPDLEIFW